MPHLVIKCILTAIARELERIAKLDQLRERTEVLIKVRKRGPTKYFAYRWICAAFVCRIESTDV
jgi:hypothetical protein